MRLALLSIVVGGSFAGFACTRTPSEAPSTNAATSVQPEVAAKPEEAAARLLARGRGVYAGSCAACHNSDPKRPGALGPELYGASEALLEARVMRAEYPAGYTPKRTTKTMSPMPQLKEEIPALHAFLNAP